MRSALLLLLVVACGSGPRRFPLEGDAAVLDKMLEGTLAAHDGFLQVAHSGGWPIATSKGYLSRQRIGARAHNEQSWRERAPAILALFESL
jgi:hypothetical protein